MMETEEIVKQLSRAEFRKQILPQLEPSQIKLVRRGRRFVWLIIALHFLMAAGVFIFVVANNPRGEVLLRLLKLLASLALMYGFWNGSVWSKWLYVIGMSFMGLALASIGFFVARQQTPEAVIGAVVIYGVAAFLFFMGGYLAFSRSVSAFLAFQRLELLPGNAAWVSLDIPSLPSAAALANTLAQPPVPEEGWGGETARLPNSRTGLAEAAAAANCHRCGTDIPSGMWWCPGCGTRAKTEG